MSEDQPAKAAGLDRWVIDEFRSGGGAVGGEFEGVSLLLITTVGAKTGKPRTNPVVYLRDGNRILVFATNSGEAKNPGWFYNLLAEPRVTIEIGEDGLVRTHSVRAVPLEGVERDRVYEIQAQRDPAFHEYQTKTSRTIPVVALYSRNPV
jgi:deazaflavin-dependent oxidoreductase (nitroreductase family)